MGVHCLRVFLPWEPGPAQVNSASKLATATYQGSTCLGHTSDPPISRRRCLLQEIQQRFDSIESGHRLRARAGWDWRSRPRPAARKGQQRWIEGIEPGATPAQNAEAAMDIRPVESQRSAHGPAPNSGRAPDRRAAREIYEFTGSSFREETL